MTLVADDSGRREQFGTDTQSGLLNRIHVHCEAQPAIFQKELDPAATLRKTITLPNHEATHPL
jgi:hypothetical protein